MNKIKLFLKQKLRLSEKYEMSFIILTGMSGAGKSQATKFLEDVGYFCIDNMPLKLFSKFGELYRCSEVQKKTALVTDIRSGTDFSDLYSFVDEMKSLGHNIKILFIDCSDIIILNRYKENKRLHPLANDGNNISAIHKEREMLSKLKEMSDVVIDTSNFSIWDLKKSIIKLFGEDIHSGIKVNICSFGFKRGIPVTADLVFDVRFIKNPYYIPELKYQTGQDEAVKDFVLGDKNCKIFLGKLEEMLLFLIPLYKNEGKELLEIGIGCTGGKHRSVAIASKIADILREKGVNVSLEHRDILK